MTAFRVSYTFTDGGPGLAWTVDAENAEKAAAIAFDGIPTEREHALSFCAVGLADERPLPPQKRGWLHVTWPPFRKNPKQLDLFA